MDEDHKIKLYASLFNSLPKLLPRAFLRKQLPSYTSPHFFFYRLLLLAYANLVASFDSEPTSLKQAVQRARLLHILQHARKAPWWTSSLPSVSSSLSLPDLLARIPIATRNELIEKEKEDFLTLAHDSDQIVWRRSGGSTTGTPFVWGLNKELLIVSVYGRFLHEFNLRDIKIPFWRNKNFYIEFNYPHGSERSEFKHVSNGDVWTHIHKEEAIQSILRLENGIVRTTPTEVFALANELQKRKIVPNVTAFSVTGQLLEEEIKKYTEDILRTKILAHFGAQELGPLSFECAHTAGSYHIFEERVIVEIVSPDGRPLPSGEGGNITITVLDNFAMPLLRYQLGDLGTLITYEIGSCPCGKTAPLLTLQSRTTDFFLFKDNSTQSVSPLIKGFNRPLLVRVVKRFQLRQVDRAHALLLVQLKEPAETIEKEVLSVLETITTTYPDDFAIEIRFTEELEYSGGKFKVFVPIKE